MGRIYSYTYSENKLREQFHSEAEQEKAHRAFLDLSLHA